MMSQQQFFGNDNNVPMPISVSGARMYYSWRTVMNGLQVHKAYKGINQPVQIFSTGRHGGCSLFLFFYVCGIRAYIPSMAGVLGTVLS